MQHKAVGQSILCYWTAATLQKKTGGRRGETEVVSWTHYVPRVCCTDWGVFEMITKNPFCWIYIPTSYIQQNQSTLRGSELMVEYVFRCVGLGEDVVNLRYDTQRLYFSPHRGGWLALQIISLLIVTVGAEPPQPPLVETEIWKRWRL
jgi:hypothetical protein